MRIAVYAGGVVFSALAVTGCGTMNSSSSELMTNAGVKQPACIPVERAVVEQRVAQYLGSCYGGSGGSLLPVGGALIPMPGFTAHKEITANSTRFNVMIEHYSMTVDIDKQPQACGTSLKVYAVTSFWKQKVADVISAAGGEPPAKCS